MKHLIVCYLPIYWIDLIYARLHKSSTKNLPTLYALPINAEQKQLQIFVIFTKKSKSTYRY